MGAHLSPVRLAALGTAILAAGAAGTFVGRIARKSYAGTSRPTASADSITRALIARGDSVYHGRIAAANCYTCHGPTGRGTESGPDLTDSRWLDCDGSYESLIDVIARGVPRPKLYPVPMPPTGGVPLTPDQVRAVAAYVYSLSHRV
jgi:mono/diheme cytochrome c family protein